VNKIQWVLTANQESRVVEAPITASKQFDFPHLQQVAALRSEQPRDCKLTPCNQVPGQSSR